MVNKLRAARTDVLKSGPSKRELKQHAQTNVETLAQIPKLNTGLTTAMEGNMFSESTPFKFRGESTHAGPSGVHNIRPNINPFIHPCRRNASYDGSSVSSLRDMDSASSWLGRIGVGAGRNAGEQNAGAGDSDGEAEDGNAGAGDGNGEDRDGNVQNGNRNGGGPPEPE